MTSSEERENLSEIFERDSESDEVRSRDAISWKETFEVRLHDSLINLDAAMLFRRSLFFSLLSRIHSDVGFSPRISVLGVIKGEVVLAQSRD